MLKPQHYLAAVLFLGAYFGWHTAFAQEEIHYEKGRSATLVPSTVTSPEWINSVPHPIATSRPMRKYHKDPMPRPDEKIESEVYDPANARHIIDPAATLQRGAAVEPCRSFIGMTNTGWNPPDPDLAVGPEHIVEVVNSSIAIFDKNTGVKLLQSTAGFWFQNTLPPPPSGFIFDPKVVYDPVAERFIILFLCTDDLSQASFLVSVSQSSNAMGGWYSYNFDATLNGEMPSATWPDYPGLGFDYDEAVYLTANQWYFGAGYAYVKVRILPKAELYSGGPVTYSDLWNLRYHNNSTAFTVKPASTYDNADGEFLLSNIWSGGNYTTYWKITDPLANPTLTIRPRVNIPSYPSPPNAVQKGGSAVGTIGAMTQEVIFRDGKVYTSFDQGFNWGSGTVAAVRMLGVDTVTSTATVDLVYGADGIHYYFPAIYVDPDDRIFAVFNRSSAEEYIGIHYVENVLNDPASKLLKLGESPRSGGAPVRWGDYSGIAPDGVDQYRVWGSSEYSGPSSNSWRTWLGQFPSLVLSPALLSPQSSEKVTLPVELVWETGATAYRVQLDSDESFNSPKVDTIVAGGTLSIGDLNDQTDYYWRVLAENGCDGNTWSSVGSFRVCNFVAGDATGDGLVTVSDAVLIINYIFSGGEPPTVLAAADVNCDGDVTVTDGVTLINYIFGTGPEPCNAC